MVIINAVKSLLRKGIIIGDDYIQELTREASKFACKALAKRWAASLASSTHR